MNEMQSARSSRAGLLGFLVLFVSLAGTGCVAPSGKILQAAYRTGVSREGEPSVLFQSAFRVRGVQSEQILLEVTLLDRRGQPLRSENGRYRNASGIVAAGKSFPVHNGGGDYENVILSLPISELDFVRKTRPEMARFRVYDIFRNQLAEYDIPIKIRAADVERAENEAGESESAITATAEPPGEAPAPAPPPPDLAPSVEHAPSDSAPTELPPPTDAPAEPASPPAEASGAMGALEDVRAEPSASEAPPVRTVDVQPLSAQTAPAVEAQPPAVVPVTAPTLATEPERPKRVVAAKTEENVADRSSGGRLVELALLPIEPSQPGGANPGSTRAAGDVQVLEVPPVSPLPPSGPLVNLSPDGVAQKPRGASSGSPSGARTAMPVVGRPQPAGTRLPPTDETEIVLKPVRAGSGEGANASISSREVGSPAVPPLPVASQKYTIQRGDSLSTIAQRMLGDSRRWPEIYQLNHTVLPSPDFLPIGVQLVLPSR